MCDVDTHRHRDLRQLFANTVLHDAPKVQRVVGFIRNTGSPLFQVLRRRLLVNGQRFLVKLQEKQRYLKLNGQALLLLLLLKKKKSCVWV